ncbi:MAG: S-layer family protein [Anaerolineae bacterium]|nr:S-layer family protein [Phycisphaerae bacterium]
MARRHINTGKLALGLAAALAAGSLTSQVLGQTVVTWTGPTAGNWNTPGNWTGGVMPNGNFDVLIDNGAAQNSVVTMNLGVGLANLSISASDQLNIANSFTLTMNGIAGVASLANAGTLSMNAAANTTALSVSASATLTATGGGAIVLNQTAAGVPVITGSGTFVNVNNAIRGAGQIATNGLRFDNRHIIDADRNGAAILIDSANVAGGFLNSGTMSASNGGSLRITGANAGGISNTGTISAGDLSNVSLEGGISISGGTYTTSGAGVVRVAAANSASLSSFANLGNITLLNNATLFAGGDISNVGSINVTASTNNTQLRFDGATTLSGGSAITIGTSGAGVAMIGGSGALTNTNNTISGAGQLGTNSLTFINQASGVVDANINAQMLLIDAPNVAGGFINNGQMRASSGGILQFTGANGGAYTNNGTVTAQNGSVVQLNGASVTGGTFSTAGTGSTHVLTSTVTLDGVANAGSMVVDNAAAFQLTNSFLNSGVLAVSAGTNTTVARVIGGGTTTLSGGGAIELSSTGAGVAHLGSGGSGILSNLNNTIRGFGQLGSNAIGYINGAAAVVDANVATQVLLVDPANTAEGVTNFGAMRASNGGILTITGANAGALANSGTIVAQTGSVVQFVSGISISGGTLATLGSGTIAVPQSNNAFVDGVTNTGNIQIANNSSLFFNGNGPITNSGSINVNAAAHFTAVQVNGGSIALAGDGAINLASAGANVAGVAGTGTLESTNTIRGFGVVGNNSLAVINHNLISASGGGMNIDPVNLGNGFVNLGIMRAETGATLSFTGANGGSVNNNGGTILAQTGSSVQLLGSMSIAGGTFTTAGTGTISVPANHNASVNGITNNGDIQIANNATLFLTGGGTITNAGSINVNASANFTSVQVSGAPIVLTGGGAINLASTGAQVAAVAGDNSLDSNNTIRGFGAVGNNSLAVINRGLIAGSGGALTIDPVNVAGGFVNVGIMRAESGAHLVITGANGGGITSTGGAINVQSGGTMTTTGNHQLAAGSVQLDGYWDNTGNASSSTANIRGAGTLNVTNGVVSVNTNGGNSGTSRIANFTSPGGASPTSTFDLNDNDLILTSGNLPTVESQIAFARHGAAWDRPGLTSTAAKNSVPKNKNLGAISGADFHIGQGAAALFDGFTIANSDIVIKFTYNGDTDLNGVVDFDDYSHTDGGFNNNRTGWFNGDFDYNGIVDFDDYSLIDGAFNTQTGTLRRALSYLNGGDRSDYGINTPALQMVMDHYQQFGQPYATSFLNAVPEPTSAGIIYGLLALATRRRRR